MIRRLLAVLCLPLFALPALGQEFNPPRVDDPLALRLICTSAQEGTMDGPAYSFVTIFSVPEKDGRSERLYVGFVGDLGYARSGQALWRGPVATRWQGLRRAPGYDSNLTARNPARYRLDRLTALPGGRMDNATMEIVLDAVPPQLRRVAAGPGGTVVLETQPLGERVPMNDSLKVATRLWQQAKADTRALRLRAYYLSFGEEAPPAQRQKPRGYWESPKKPYLLAVCRADDPGRSALHFLPPRFAGWKFMGLLATPAPDDLDGSFVADLFSEYWGKSVEGRETTLGSRSHVRVSLGGMTVETAQSQLEYEPEGDWWVPGEPVKASKKINDARP